jgi:hypothetical protein
MKLKSQEEDPDNRLITIWNHNLHRIKPSTMVLQSQSQRRSRGKTARVGTPIFARIKERIKK